MRHTKNNLVPAFIFVLAVIPFWLVGISGRYLAAEVCTRLTRSTFFTLALILPVTCDMGINFAIVVGAISAQIATVFSVGLRLEGAVALMLITGTSTVLSILFSMMVTVLLNRAREREVIVSIVAGQLSPVIHQFISMVAYGLLIQPRGKDILLNRGIRVGNMVDARNISNIFKGILSFRLDGKTYSSSPLVIILSFSLVLPYIQKAQLGILVRTVGTDGETANTLGIAGSRVRNICIVISTIFTTTSQVLFMAGFETINVYTGHLGLDIFTAATILVGGASIRKARVRSCFIGVILFHALFIISPMAGQNLFHNPSVGKYFRPFLAYEVVMTATIMNLRSERIKVQST